MEEREGIKKTKRKREEVEGERERKEEILLFIFTRTKLYFIRSELLVFPLITYNRHPFGMKEKKS